MKYILISIFTALIAACASNSSKEQPQAAAQSPKQPSQPQASIEAKQLGAEQEAATVAEISFAKGKAELSAEAKKRLGDIRARIQKTDKPGDLEVIAWSDQEYPSVHAGKLPDASRDLAYKRGENIQKFLKQAAGDKDVDINIHNMAERPGSIEKLWQGKDQRIKKSLETSGIPNTDTSVKTPSKASKAIVLLIPED